MVNLVVFCDPKGQGVASRRVVKANGSKTKKVEGHETSVYKRTVYLTETVGHEEPLGFRLSVRFKNS